MLLLLLLRCAKEPFESSGVYFGNWQNMMITSPTHSHAPWPSPTLYVCMNHLLVPPNKPKIVTSSCTFGRFKVPYQKRNWRKPKYNFGLSTGSRLKQLRGSGVNAWERQRVCRKSISLMIISCVNAPKYNFLRHKEVV